MHPFHYVGFCETANKLNYVFKLWPIVIKIENKLLFNFLGIKKCLSKQITQTPYCL